MATFRTRTAKDGTKSVQVQVRMAGHPAQGNTFPNMTEAKRWATTIEASMIEGRNFKGAQGAKKSLADAIERFRAEVLPLKRNGSMYGFTLDWWVENHGTKKLGEVSRGWLTTSRAQLLAGTYTRATPGSRRSLYPAKGPREIVHCQMAGNTRGACGRYPTCGCGDQGRAFQRTPATANRYMAALSAVFSQVCGDWEWLLPAANPFQGFAKLPEGKNKGMAYADQARAKLLQETSKDPQLHVLVQVALATAARAGELLALTWSHVELGETEGRLMFTDTKNGEARIAWLFGDALEAMKVHAARKGVGPIQDGAALVRQLAHLNLPVFPGQWSHKHQKYGRYDYLPRLHKALKAAGLDMKRPFHALRHTAATTLARRGANGHQLKAFGGWKSNAVDTYIHLAAQDTKELARRLAGPAQEAK